MRHGAGWIRATGIGAVLAAAAIAVPVSAARTAPRASVSSVPTLGVASAQPTGAGFGRVRPRTVSYGGDPTSFVSKVRWHSWGGTRAVGHGTADWVWPGWCVACGSVELPATVVAFDRTTCQGHSAYARVEWYFPSRGMSFSPRLSTVNICAHKPAPAGTIKQLKCGRVSLRSHGSVSAVAGHITVFDSPISCATARRFVASSGAARYLNRNARFTVHGWWCGSELSMDLGGPQSFSCVHGDFTNLSFDLKR